MNERICFITLMNLTAVPYLSKYVDLIGYEYDVIYWNRYGVNEECDAKNTYAMNYSIAKDCSMAKKVFGYMRFKSYATRILKENDYKKVVLLSGNVAVLLKNILLEKYKNRYIIDIRDYYKEYNRQYYNSEKKLIDNSLLAVISSEAYKSFLPEHDYVVVHNSPNISGETLKQYFSSRREFLINRKESRIILSFIGGVRFFEQDKKILRFFGNDDRFFIRYIGVGADILKEYCDNNGYHNTYFHDRFPPERTLDYYVETDFILNLYGSGTPLLDYALSNKLYYAATLGIPILVCPGTYMEEIAVGNGFGLAIDIDDPRSKDLIVSFSNKNKEDLSKKCVDFLHTVTEENAKWSKIVENALR